MSYQYALIYFDGPGRAEIARLLFAQAGVLYDDQRITYEDWPKWKPSKYLKTIRKLIIQHILKHDDFECSCFWPGMPFGQLPILRVSKNHLAQSNTIYRYLAKEFGLAGKDDLESGLCDGIVDAVRDVVDAHREWRSTS